MESVEQKEVDAVINSLESKWSEKVWNKGLLLKVADYIETHPKELDMEAWCEEGKSVVTVTDDRNFFQVLFGIGKPVISRVETLPRGCISYHIVKASGNDPFPESANVPAIAQKELSLSFEETGRLIFTEYWPEPFYKEWKEVETGSDFTQRAWIAAERCRHFARTGK